MCPIRDCFIEMRNPEHRKVINLSKAIQAKDSKFGIKRLCILTSKFMLLRTLSHHLFQHQRFSLKAVSHFGVSIFSTLETRINCLKIKSLFKSYLVNKSAPKIPTYYVKYDFQNVCSCIEFLPLICFYCLLLHAFICCMIYHTILP